MGIIEILEVVREMKEAYKGFDKEILIDAVAYTLVKAGIISQNLTLETKQAAANAYLLCC